VQQTQTRLKSAFVRPLEAFVIVSDVVEKTSTRHRSRIPCVVVGKKMKKVCELSTKIRVIYLQQ